LRRFVLPAAAEDERDRRQGEECLTHSRILASKTFTRFRRHHLQRVIHTIEVIEQSGHRRDLDDLAFVVLPAKPREERVVDAIGVDGQLLRVCERRLFLLIERSALEIENRLELSVRRAVPRSLRGVGRVSIVATVQA
jgi:hypothetical protein